MADFLTRLAERTLRTVPVAQPILSSRFAPEASMAPTPSEVEIWTTHEQRRGDEQGGGPAGRVQDPSLHFGEEPAGRGPAGRVQDPSLHFGEENMIPAAEQSIDEEHTYTITHQSPSVGENHPDQPNAAITRRRGGGEEVGRESLRQDVGVGDQNVGTGLVPVRGTSLAGPAGRVQDPSLHVSHVSEERTMPGAAQRSGDNMVIEAGTSESPILEIDEQVHHEHIAPIQSSMQDTAANPRAPAQQPQHPHSYGDQVHERSEGLAQVMEIHEEQVYTSTPSNTLASDETAPSVPSSDIPRGTPISEASNLVQAQSSESSNRPGAKALPEVARMPHQIRGSAEATDTPIIEVHQHTPVYPPSMQAAGDSRDKERVEVPEKAERLIPAINIHEEHIHTLVRQNMPTRNVRFDQPLVRQERSSTRQSTPVGDEMAALVPPVAQVAHPETITSRSDREMSATVPPIVESHEHIPVYLRTDQSSRKSGSSSRMDAGVAGSPIVEVHERIIESDRPNVIDSPKASSQLQPRSNPYEDKPLIQEVVHSEEQVETTQLIGPGIVPLGQQPPLSRAAQRQNTSNGKQNSMPLTEQDSAKSAPEPASAAPSIRVTIGRIDVRAITPPPAAPAPRPKPGRSSSTLSLDDYLKRNRGGEL